MATLVLLMSVLAIVGDSLPSRLRRTASRFAVFAVGGIGNGDVRRRGNYSLDLELRETAVDATTLAAGANAEPTSLWGIDKSADDEARMRLLLPGEHERRNAIE